jgi:hypothetical protein
MWQREQCREGSREMTLELPLPLEDVEPNDPVGKFNCEVVDEFMVEGVVGTNL